MDFSGWHMSATDWVCAVIGAVVALILQGMDGPEPCGA